MATEEPPFTIVQKFAHYEIRQYGAVVVAETTVNAEFSQAGSSSFRILAQYIFGNNISKNGVSLSTSRPQEGQSGSGESEKIQMTAPVTQIKRAAGFLVQFTMPQQYTLESLPSPKDSRVQLRQIPARKVVVYKYSGSWAESRYQAKLAKFRELLLKDGVQTVGEPEFARFNSPFQLSFLRRNEIWLELK